MKLYAIYIGEAEYRTCIGIFSDRIDCIAYMEKWKVDQVEIHLLDDAQGEAEYDLTLDMLKEL